MYFTEAQMNQLHHELSTVLMALFDLPACQCCNFLLPAVGKLHVHHWRQVPQFAVCVVSSETLEGYLDFTEIYEGYPGLTRS